MSEIKRYLKLLYIPLSIFVAYLSVILLWNLFGFPTGESLVILIKEYFAKYGLATIFIGSLIEGFFLLGQYFPGGFIIFLGVISAGKDIARATEVVLVVMLSFFIAYFLNYLMGRYGFYKLFLKFGLRGPLEKAQEKLKKRELSTILLNYWEPNLSSIVATAAGTLKMPIKRFLAYSLVGILIWESFWGILVFSLGNKALDLMGIRYVSAIIFIWILAIIVTEFVRSRLEKNKIY